MILRLFLLAEWENQTFPRSSLTKQEETLGLQEKKTSLNSVRVPMSTGSDLFSLRENLWILGEKIRTL